MKHRLTAGLLCAAMLCGALGASAGTAHAASTEEIQALALINEAREAEGIAPLLTDKPLHYMASLRATELLRNFSHARPDDGKGWASLLDEEEYSTLKGAECIALTSADTAKENAERAVEMLLGSSMYHDRLLDADLTAGAVGMFETMEGTYWAVLLVQPYALDSGDPDGNGAVDSTDAAMILEACAAFGAQNMSDLTAAQQMAGDVSGDKKLDSTDAAYVLEYAAYVGSNGSSTLADFLKNR